MVNMITSILNFGRIKTKLSPPLLITGLMFFAALIFLFLNSPEFFVLKNVVNTVNQCAVLAILNKRALLNFTDCEKPWAATKKIEILGVLSWSVMF